MTIAIMSLLAVNNLTKIYRNDGLETPALRGVTFSVEPGEFVAIMGPSGSGKSTLLQILGFLDRQTAGEYRFADKGYDDYAPEEIARVRNKKMGFVFQSFNLLARASVLDNVKLPLLYSAVPEAEWEERARKAIEVVGLLHRLDHESARLSGGEKQRVAMARALVNEPQVIFADEPTGNLDSKSGHEVMRFISDLCQQHGKTVLLITHEPDIAAYARRVIMMRDGVIESDHLTT